MRRYFTLRCIGMHLTLAVLLPAFAALTIWQFDRATSGNTLSWAYTFEWPLFGGYAIYVWWQLIHDDPTERQMTRDELDAHGTVGASTSTGDGGDPAPVRVRPEDVPGWALGEARRRRAPVAGALGDHVGGDTVAGAVVIDGARDDAGPSDADPALAAYNRYLAELRAADAEPVERRRRHGVAH